MSDLAKKQPGYKTLRKRLKSREKAIQVNSIGLILISIIIYLRTRKRITTQQLTTRNTRTRKATNSYDYFMLVSTRETKKKASLNSLNNKRKRDKNETKSLAPCSCADLTEVPTPFSVCACPKYVCALAKLNVRLGKKNFQPMDFSVVA